MKFLISIILTATLLLNSFSNIFVYFGFKLNQNEIANTLCIKKEIKENTCLGKCHLTKQLKKVAENEKKTNSNYKEKSELVYTAITPKYDFLVLFTIVNKKSFTVYPLQKTTSFIVGVFHPPTA